VAAPENRATRARRLSPRKKCFLSPENHRRPTGGFPARKSLDENQGSGIRESSPPPRSRSGRDVPGIAGKHEEFDCPFGVPSPSRRWKKIARPIFRGPFMTSGVSGGGLISAARGWGRPASAWGSGMKRIIDQRLVVRIGSTFSDVARGVQGGMIIEPLTCRPAKNEYPCDFIERSSWPWWTRIQGAGLVKNMCGLRILSKRFTVGRGMHCIG